MFQTYNINGTTWEAVPRADLDASVSTSSRVFHDGGTGYAKVKLVPLDGNSPDVAIFQIATSECDATGKAIANAETGAIKLTAARRITCTRTNPDVSVDAQLDQEIGKELILFGVMLASIEQQAAMLTAWSS